MAVSFIFLPRIFNFNLNTVCCQAYFSIIPENPEKKLLIILSAQRNQGLIFLLGGPGESVIIYEGQNCVWVNRPGGLRV